MIIAIEGPNVAGKTTLVKALHDRFLREGISCEIVPEYVDLIGDENRQPDRPFNCKRDLRLEGEFYIDLEQQLQRRIRNSKADLIIRDRSFYTCLAYAELSGNPVSRQMFDEYLKTPEYLHPDLILYLDIDLASPLYERRLEQRKGSNRYLRGLNYKLDEFSYIYDHSGYRRIFRERFASQHSSIVFTDPVGTSQERIWSIVRRNCFTRRAVIWPGYRCDARCIFCYNDGLSMKDKAYADLVAEIDRNRTVYGNTHIDFMGGEPTLHPEIVSLVGHCAASGIKPTLITNGFRLADKDFVGRLKEAGVHDFLISMHGTGENADRIFGTGKKGHYRLQLQALDNCSEAGIPFRINTTLIRDNKKELRKLAEKAVERSVRVVNFITFNPHFSWSTKADIAFQEKHGEIAPHLKEALDLLNQNHIRANVRYLPFCQLKGYEDHVCNCAQLPYDHDEWDFNSWHDCREKHPDAAWYRAKARSQADRNGSTHAAACGACALREICDGFNAQYLARFGESEAEPYAGALITDPLIFKHG
jgi:MoaA/NifB/PqqE/SkfB family radical SAM enzyme/thymidylate kinase